MSAKDLSDTVVTHIMQGLKEKLAEDLKAGRAKYNAGKIEYTEDTREITGKSQLGVISERGMQLLSEQFGRAYSTSSTFDKLIKNKIEGYKNYPKIYAYLKSLSAELVRDELLNLSSQAANILSSSGLVSDFLNYYTTTFGQVQKIYSSANSQVSGFSAVTTSHAQFNKRFIGFLNSKGINPVLTEFIDANTDAGHILGVFNDRFAKAFDLNVESSSPTSFKITSARDLVTDNPSDQQQYQQVLQAFQNSLQLMSEADFLTGNLLSDIEIDADASKAVFDPNNPILSAVEIQISYLNQKAGRRLAVIGRRLNNLKQLVDPKKSITQGSIRDFKTELGKLYKSFESLAQYIDSISEFYVSQNILNIAETAAVKDIKKRSAEIFNRLIETSGSDPIIVSIGKIVAHTIEGKKLPNKQKTNAVIPTAKLGTTANKKRTPVVKSKKPRAKSTGISKSVNFIATPQSSTNLLAIINAGIRERVVKNMGTGNRRDVLNYRTGRFADSVRVERLSESRAGMITAFYTYMKNPYATFSSGGRQELPRSRDPKLLISKSIRELVQQQVGNRLRAVLI